MPQADITSENVAFRADDGNAPACRAKGSEEDIALLTVHLELAHAFLAPEHGVAKFGKVRVGSLQRLGEDGLVEKLGGIGMHEKGASLAEHYAVGVRVRLDGGDSLREPAQ